MTKRNPDYDFKWCPGCGDFGVLRALDKALEERCEALSEPIENTVFVAGIGCSGNIVHLQDGPKPYGIHGIHGRTLPIAYGIKAANPELNVVVAAGDGDFLSIGGEHIGPAARRNLDIVCIIMDNGIYGLTKGQASPTTQLNVITSTTPLGKLDEPENPLELYLTNGVGFIASMVSTKPKDITQAILAGIEYPGLAIIHIQSPCTTYNDTYSLLKGDVKNGVEPLAVNLPEDHDSTDYEKALSIARSNKIPVGILYSKEGSQSMNQKIAKQKQSTNAPQRSVDELLTTLSLK
jgi:2-oxoglutarate/2-oxoacid ferredoxin oxidoreductase subunit beta